METIAVSSVVIVFAISLYGLYKIISNITFKKTKDRYSYVLYLDEDGNHYEKVVDNFDDYNEKN